MSRWGTNCECRECVPEALPLLCAGVRRGTVSVFDVRVRLRLGEARRARSTATTVRHRELLEPGQN